MDRSALGFAFNSVMDFSLFTFLKVLLDLNTIHDHNLSADPLFHDIS